MHGRGGDLERSDDGLQCPGRRDSFLCGPNVRRGDKLDERQTSASIVEVIGRHHRLRCPWTDGWSEVRPGGILLQMQLG